MLTAIALGGVWALCLGTWEPTARSRQWAADLEWALCRAGLTKKAAALLLGMDLSQFSRDVATGRLYAGRVVELGEDVEDALAEIRARRRGKMLLGRDLARLLDGMDELIGTRRQMAKMRGEKKEGAA